MSRLVTDDMISDALDFLAKSSQEAAAARGMRVRREFMRKRARAHLVNQSDEKSVAAREAWAEDHDDYAAACEAEAEAVEADEFLRAERNKAETVIQCWQTENANRRAGASFR